MNMKTVVHEGREISIPEDAQYLYCHSEGKSVYKLEGASWYRWARSSKRWVKAEFYEEFPDILIEEVWGGRTIIVG